MSAEVCSSAKISYLKKISHVYTPLCSCALVKAYSTQLLTIYNRQYVLETGRHPQPVDFSLQYMVLGCTQACLRLSRAQKDRIVVLYEEYVQEGAAAHQTCIDIASMVQVWYPGLDIDYVDIQLCVLQHSPVCNRMLSI